MKKQLILFRSFFVISAVTLGGGLAMVPVIQKEFTEKHKWLSEEDMADIIAVTQSSPGIIASNIAVLTGYRVAGVSGAFFAAIGASLPPFISMVILASLFHSLSSSETVNHIFTGVRAAICALILAAVIRMTKKIIKGRFELILALFGFIGMLFNMNGIWLVVISGISGLSFALFRKKKEAAK
ncbi:MAG: chromate transporter [Lentisphaeria bacterium]|nr:chromate transporter [Lentisphaeria bacterium]